MRETPWLTENAINYILDYINNQKKQINMLEFGSGGSTIFFSKFNINLISIEHDEIWAYNVQNKINKKNCKLVLKKSNVIENTDYLETPYFNAVDDLEIKNFDIILIDGRNRVDCFKKSEPLLKKGGLLILDNSEREEYKEIFILYEDKPHINFIQEKPDNYGFYYPNWTTAIFLK